MDKALIVICIFVVLPAMVMWFIDRQRRLTREQTWGGGGGGETDDGNRKAPGLSELAATAERLEQRIDALEKILDAEAPDWRQKHRE